MWIRLTLNIQWSLCLFFQNARVEDENQHSQLLSKRPTLHAYHNIHKYNLVIEKFRHVLFRFVLSDIDTKPYLQNYILITIIYYMLYILYIML